MWIIQTGRDLSDHWVKLLNIIGLWIIFSRHYLTWHTKNSIVSFPNKHVLIQSLLEELEQCWKELEQFIWNKSIIRIMESCLERKKADGDLALPDFWEGSGCSSPLSGPLIADLHSEVFWGPEVMFFLCVTFCSCNEVCGDKVSLSQLTTFIIF